MSSYNSRIVGLILMRFYVGCPWSSAVSFTLFISPQGLM